MKAIDFQMCRVARPTIDVAYLLWTSTTPDLRREHEGELLDRYHSTLAGRLEALGAGEEELPYPREQFDKDYRDCCLFGYQISQMHTMVSSRYNWGSRGWWWL